MRFANAVFNVYTLVFFIARIVFKICVLDYVRQNIDVIFALAFDYSL